MESELLQQSSVCFLAVVEVCVLPADNDYPRSNEMFESRYLIKSDRVKLSFAEISLWQLAGVHRVPVAKGNFHLPPRSRERVRKLIYLLNNKQIRIRATYCQYLYTLYIGKHNAIEVLSP